MMRTGRGLRVLKAGLFGLLLVLTLPASGVAAVDGQVAVSRSGDEASSRQEALGRMLQRLAGQRLPDVRRALAGTVQQYIDSSAVREESGGESLVLTFDVPALRTAVTDRGVPVWLRERPRLLIWAALENASGRRLLGSDEALGRRLRAAAGDYGLPVLLPVLDLTDRQAVTPADIRGGFSRSVARASRRYGGALALMIGLRHAQGGWHANWTLIRDGESIAQGRADGAVPDAMADDLWAAVARRLRKDYTTVPGQANEGTLVTVTGVEELADLAAAERHLSDGVGVIAVRLQAVLGGTRARFRVTAEVSRQRLKRDFDNDPRWRRASVEDNSGLVYRWRGGGGES